MFLKPSRFASIHPFDSVFGSFEHEIVAKNIMVILSRSGDVFRSLSCEEYERERLKDGNFSLREELFFKDVIGYCKSPDTAVLFCKVWANLAITS